MEKNYTEIIGASSLITILAQRYAYNTNET